MKSDAGPLCSTWFDPCGRLRLPFGARIGFALYLKSPSFAPPRSGPCRARLPWRVRLWVGPPLALPSRGAGGPLCLFLPPPFFLCFSGLVRIISGLGVSSRRANWLAPVWLKVRFRQVHKRLCLKPPSGRPTRKHTLRSYRCSLRRVSEPTSFRAW